MFIGVTRGRVIDATSRSREDGPVQKVFPSSC